MKIYIKNKKIRTIVQIISFPFIFLYVCIAGLFYYTGKGLNLLGDIMVKNRFSDYD